MRHILSILLENEAGALSRVVGLFSARGYNIDSLTVATTEDATLSRMTIVTHGSEEVVEQITKQLNKLIEVVKVIDLNESEHIEREMMLIKVRSTGKDREEMKRMQFIATLKPVLQLFAALHFIHAPQTVQVPVLFKRFKGFRAYAGGWRFRQLLAGLLFQRGQLVVQLIPLHVAHGAVPLRVI